MRRLLLATLAIAGCWRDPSPSTAPSPPPPTPTTPASPPPGVTSQGDACTTDADCVVTNWAGCCACPQCSVADPTARSTSALAAEQQQCAVMRCDLNICNIAGMCPPGEAAELFTPVCRANVCVGVRR
jgi:hypothetical protein